jgi:hypothetical protein
MWAAGASQSSCLRFVILSAATGGSEVEGPLFPQPCGCPILVRASELGWLPAKIAPLRTTHYPLSTTHRHFFCAFFLLTGVVGFGTVHRSSITLTAVALNRCAASPFFPSAPGSVSHDPVSFTFAPLPVFN